CPHVSAAIATVQAMRLARGMNKLTPNEVRNILVGTVIDLGSHGYDPLYGYGFLDVLRLVQVAVGT
ncbi:MAG: hypothetical protein RMH84_03180, partial [Sulfolobales archaeon]|nr:hypothetical protein [Sulfolobales archaeon]MDW8010580.1 hypothetical protein [Sulfolobales archaeon]